MKPANASESTRLLLNVPHVPSSITLRPSVVCDTSLVLVEHTNMILIDHVASASIVAMQDHTTNRCARKIHAWDFHACNETILSRQKELGVQNLGAESPCHGLYVNTRF